MGLRLFLLILGHLVISSLTHVLARGVLVHEGLPPAIVVACRSAREGDRCSERECRFRNAFESAKKRIFRDEVHGQRGRSSAGRRDGLTWKNAVVASP